MRPDELVDALRHLVDEFSELELSELLQIAADQARTFDASAGNHASRAAYALLQDHAERRPRSLLC